MQGCYRDESSAPSANRGTIDLGSTDICNEIIELKGYWEYYPSSLIPPADLKKKSSMLSDGYAFLPRIWNAGRRLYIPNSGRGYATYRLIIKTGDTTRCSPAVRVHQILSSYNLYINGKLLHSSGRPGTSVSSTVPGSDDALIPLPPGQPQYEVVLQAANFHSPAGGIRHAPEIGDMTALMQSRERDNIKSVFIVSALLLLFLYQVFMFAIQREELEFLYFGIFCFCTMIYSLGLYNTYWSGIIPFPSWSARYMIMAISVYTGLVAVLAYLQRLFPLDVPRRLVYVTLALNVAFSVIMLLLPPGYYACMFPVLHSDIICFTLI